MILDTTPIRFPLVISNEIHKDIYYHVRGNVSFKLQTDISYSLFTVIYKSVIQNVWGDIDTTGQLTMYE
jgi:hypothetical protein